MVEKDTTNWK